MRGRLASLLVSLAALVGPGVEAARADQVIADDAIVQGSFCVGFDCVDGEDFPYDMVRLKENNIRIVFRDDSVARGTADWQLTANDTGSGGLTRFSIDFLDGGTIPFRIDGTAPTDSLHLTSTGRLGVGTATPASALHVAGALRIDGDLFVTGGLRAGRVPSASVGQDGRATVTFDAPYERDYVITLTPVIAKSKGNPSAIVVDRDETGFTFAVTGKPADYTEIVWTTRFTGEF